MVQKRLGLRRHRRHRSNPLLGKEAQQGPWTSVADDSARCSRAGQDEPLFN